MIKSKAKPEQSKNLKARVQGFLNSNLAVIKKIPPVDVRNLFEDLQIYQTELEKHGKEMQRLHRKLQESECRYKNFLNNLSDAAYEMDSSGKITYANKMGEKITGLQLKDIIGKSAIPLFSIESQGLALDVYQRALNGENPECELTLVSGRIFHFKTEPLRDKENKIIGVFGIARDITERKHAEEILMKMHEELEKRVEKRTIELAKINKVLEKKTINLEDANTALNVLLKKRNEDRIEIEEKILANFNELILPLTDRLKGSQMDERQKTWVDILERNLKDIISPFSRKLNSKFWGLTSQEFQVANFVKNGKTTKEIANLLRVAASTVDTYRNKIRKKLDIKNKKVNLKTYLSDLE